VAAPAIPDDDRGLTLGDGLFETLLAKGGELVAAEAHLDRLAAGCSTLGLPAPDRGLARRLMTEAVAAAPAPRLAVRLTLTAGSGGRGLDRPAAPALRLFARADPIAEASGPARLAVSSVRRNAGSPASRLKALAYLDNVLARREALAAGADEALMLNGAGEVACAAAANIFWVREGRLFTPALDCGVLAGVMRAAVLEIAGRMGIAAAEVRAPLDAMAAADEIFLTNSLVGVRPVAALDGRTPPGGGFAQALRRAVSEAGLA